MLLRKKATYAFDGKAEEVGGKIAIMPIQLGTADFYGSPYACLHNSRNSFNLIKRGKSRQTFPHTAFPQCPLYFYYYFFVTTEC